MSEHGIQSCIVNLAELDPERNGGQRRVAREVCNIFADGFESGRLDVHFVVGWRFSTAFEAWLGRTGLQVIPFYAERDLVSALYSQIRPDLIISPLQGAWPFGSTNPYPGVVHIVTQADALAFDLPELYDAVSLADRRRRYADLPLATFIATDSEHSRARLIFHTGLPPDRIRVVPLAGELPTGTLPPLPNEVRQPYVFYPANGWPHKRHGLLLQAIQLIRRVRPEVRLVLAGWQEPAYIDTLVRLHNCSPDDFVRLGYVRDDAVMASLYRGAEALMFTSTYEGFGMPVLEAMQHDCPVICAPVTSLPEIGGHAALYVDSDDPAVWASTFLEDLPRRRKELVQLGRQQAAKYSWSKARQKWIELLADAGLQLPVQPASTKAPLAPQYRAALRALNAWASRHLESEGELHAKEDVIQDQARQLWAADQGAQEREAALERFRTSPGFWLENGPFASSPVVRTLGRLGRQLFQIQFPSVVFELQQHAPRPLRPRPRLAAIPRPVPDSPSISIVTPSLNHGRFIDETVRSVLDSGYPGLQYVVQDGGSTDETLSVLRAYATRLTAWESKPDAGQAQAVNLGFARTDGDIMAYLNSDDVLLPGALHYVGTFFKQHPKVDVIYGHRIIIDESGHEVGRWILPPHDPETLYWADYVPQETLFWRRSAWDKVGAGLDESYKFALDWDLLLRLQQAGASIQRVPRFLALFRVHGSQKTSAQMAGLGMREMDRLRTRNLGRSVGLAEVQQRVRAYQQRSVLYRLAFRVGLVQY